jgi:hypothetical protein
MKIESILESVKHVEEAIVPAKDAKPTAAPAKRTMNPQPGVRSRIEPTKPAPKVQKKTGAFADKKEVEEARDLPGNQERIDVAEPKGKITGADFKALRAKKKDKVEEAEIEEAVKHTKTGRIHKAEPGGYGRKDDEDDEGKKVKAVVKRGRGRPKKHADSETGDVKTYDFAKDLQSFMIGNLPSGKLPGKPGKKHKLKDWMEHVQANMIAESAQIAEVALDPSQLAVPKVAGTGTSTTAQPGAAGTQARPGQQMGAAVVDFKNPQDPLKAALQKAVQQKQVSVLGEDDAKFEDMSDAEIIKHCKQQGLEKSCVRDGEGGLANREECIELLKQHTKDDDKVEEAAPKGWEGTVKAMKKHKEIDNPWALAHYMKNKGYESHKKESIEESVESTGQTLLEGYTFEELMGRFPHEHKMCQEGWGMDENMYEALCDHYFKEGRIPYKVWHGPLEELRKHVEECYMEDASAMEGFKPTDTTGDRHRQLYPDTTKPFAHKPAVTQTPAPTPFSVDPIAAVTDRAYDAGAKLAGAVKSKLGMREDDMAESALERSLRQSSEGMAEGLAEDANMDNKKLDEKYMGFKKTVAAIKKGGSAEDPEAVAAAIGRKKYGKEKFQKAAAAGKKLGESDVQMESWEAQLASMLVEGDMPQQHKQPEKVEECGDEPAGMEGNDIVKALAALLGMAPKSSPMSVAGDDGAHAIEVIPVAPGDVQDQLSHDQQSDTSGGDLDFIKRMLGARMGPDYAEERAMEGQTEAASSGDSHMSPLSKVEEADLEEVSRGEWIKQQDAKAEKSGKDKFQAFGQTFDTDDVKEDAQSEEDSMALSSEANRDAALATAYAADNHTNDDDNVAVSEGSDTCESCGAMMEADHVCEAHDEEHLSEISSALTGRAYDAAQAKRDAALQSDELPSDMRLSLAKAASKQMDKFRDYTQKARDREKTAAAQKAASGMGFSQAQLRKIQAQKAAQGVAEGEELNEWANSPAGHSEDEQFQTDMDFMTKVISGGLNNIKRDQTVLPSTAVVTKEETTDAEFSIAEQLRKLAGIN